MSRDTIEIRGLQVPTHIGWTDEERAREQVVSIDISLGCDLATAALSDDLGDTVDYDRLIREVDELVRSAKSRLVEHLAGKVADSISRYKVVDRVTVEIHKIQLEIPGMKLDDVSVRIERDFT